MFDVIVIGAGLSGLQAAYTAQQAGLSVAVLEARDRVGGKIWSVPLASGRGYADLGGAWVNLTLQPRVGAYVKQFGLDTEVQRLDGRAVMQESKEAGGSYGCLQFTPAEKQNLERIRDHIQAESLKPGPPRAQDDNVTLDQYVRDLGALPKTAKMVNLWAQVMHGLESSEYSAAWFIDYCRRNRGLLAIRADDASGGQHLRFRGGSQSLATHLASLIGPSHIHLSTPVLSITDAKTHVTVTSTTGQTFVSRKAILSIPSTMYKELNIQPNLPPRLRQITDATVLGDYNKAIVCYDRPWWREKGFNGYFASFEGPVILARDTSVESARHFSLTCFVNGKPGRFWSKLPPHERRAVVLRQLATVFNADTEPGSNHEVWKPIEFFDQIWQHERFSRGALAPITALGHYVEFADVYGKPVGNLHFVGTEYSTEWKGYMEGALCSGEVGGLEAVDALQGKGRASL
ncbi:Putative Flavin-containing amine oxidase [Aspergillus calidoustus]|uniref:Amine oxidase n=1 Tax=Aspergillus calidoustus TaxID=454130 RepID=A0A0U5G6W1_ASPCI|nr:Putative Flavin-containing amine oxidase [Aspergillus calidoustus]